MVAPSDNILLAKYIDADSLESLVFFLKAHPKIVITLSSKFELKTSIIFFPNLSV